MASEQGGLVARDRNIWRDDIPNPRINRHCDGVVGVGAVHIKVPRRVGELGTRHAHHPRGCAVGGRRKRGRIACAAAGKVAQRAAGRRDVPDDKIGNRFADREGQGGGLASEQGGLVARDRNIWRDDIPNPRINRHCDGVVGVGAVHIKVPRRVGELGTRHAHHPRGCAVGGRRKRGRIACAAAGKVAQRAAGRRDVPDDKIGNRFADREGQGGGLAKRKARFVTCNRDRGCCGVARCRGDELCVAECLIGEYKAFEIENRVEAIAARSSILNGE